MFEEILNLITGWYPEALSVLFVLAHLRALVPGTVTKPEWLFRFWDVIAANYGSSRNVQFHVGVKAGGEGKRRIDP